VLFRSLAHPIELIVKVATSRWWAFFLPLVLVPFRSVRAVGGLLPTVLLLGAANYPMMRELGGYYALPLLAFSVFGVLDAWAVWRSSPTVKWREGLVFVAFGLFACIGGGYPRAVAVDPTVNRHLAAAWEAAKSAPIVCTQPAFFPHLGYSRRLQPLSDFECMNRPGAVALVHPELDLLPFDPWIFLDAIKGWQAQYPTKTLEGGFLLIGPVPER
jgi:hypothetical protein